MRTLCMIVFLPAMGRVGSYTLGLRKGVGRITHYHSVLKKKVRLRKAVFIEFSIMFVILAFSEVTVLKTPL